MAYNCQQPDNRYSRATVYRRSADNKDHRPSLCRLSPDDRPTVGRILMTYLQMKSADCRPKRKKRSAD